MAVLKVISVCLPEDSVAIIDRVKVKKRDPSRSNTIRLLLLERLAEMSLLPDEDKKALGLGGLPTTPPHVHCPQCGHKIAVTS